MKRHRDRDIKARDIRRAIERLETRFGTVEPPDDGTSPSNPQGSAVEDGPPTPEDHAAAIMADLSTEQRAKLIAIERDFDDTEPEPDRRGANTEAYLPIGPGPHPGETSGYLSEAEKATLDVLTGGGEWIDVTPADMAAARQIDSDDL